MKIVFKFNMRLVFLIFSCFLLGNNVSAQTAKAYLKAGDKALKKKDYYSAMKYYQEAYFLKEKNMTAAFQVAEMARQFHAYDLAEEYYRIIFTSEEKDKFPLTLFRMAQVKKRKGQYKQAEALFRQYLKEEESGGNPQFIAIAKSEIEQCKWAQEIKSDEAFVKISQLNKRVNTPYSEFAPLLRGDTLYYSSYRYTKKDDIIEPQRKISKVLTSVKGSKGRTMRYKFNSDVYNTAHTTFSKDGKKLYYTICDYTDRGEIRCAIYQCEQDRRKRWKKSTKLSETVNVPGFTATHPMTMYDSVAKKEYLLFVSNRTGGKGKLDIWSVPFKKNGKLGKPVNLQSINTAEDDITPFFHEASGTLFFSSEGYRGLGGYDIYKSKKNGQQFSTPEHTGIPLNSSYNDIYFVLTPDSTTAYISSNRIGSFFLEKDNEACCNDIYKVNILKDTTSNEPPPEDSLVVEIDTPGIDIVTIPPKSTKPKAEPVPTSLEDFLPLALYFDNDEPDKRTRRSTTKKTYGQSYDSYIVRKPTYLEEYVDPLPEAIQEDARFEMLDFFNNKVDKGYRYLNLFSDILLKRLQDGEKVEIFVKGFTSPRAKSDYNIYLGKRRISSVRNHFNTYQSGVFQQYLNAGKLIITERSFGETKASASVSDELNDQRNSIYSVGAAQERRVELVEIKRQ